MREWLTAVFNRADEATLRWGDASCVWLYDRFGIPKMIAARALIFVSMFVAVLHNSVRSIVVTAIICLALLSIQVFVEFLSHMQGHENFSKFCEANYRYSWVRYFAVFLTAFYLYDRFYEHNWGALSSDVSNTLYWYVLGARYPNRPRRRRVKQQSGERDLVWSAN